MPSTGGTINARVNYLSIIYLFLIIVVHQGSCKNVHDLGFSFISKDLMREELRLIKNKEKHEHYD